MKQILLFVAIIALSLNGYSQMLNNLSISGKITNKQSDWVTLSVLGSGQMQSIDSAKISSNNSFFISTNIDGSNFYQLTNGGKQYTILVLEPGENVKVDINGLKMLQPSRVEGSPLTQQLYNMLVKINSIDLEQKKLETAYQTLSQGVDPEKEAKTQAIVQKYQALESSKTTYIKQQINTNPSLASLLFIEKLPIDENLDLYKKLDKTLYPKYKNNEFVVSIHDKVKSKLKMAIGSHAPEIALQSPEGNIIKLSSLKGKVVLIDFWASWCSPCRRDNPHNVKLYQKYKDKGFEIYAVSLDKTKSDWVKAIKDDKLSWIHVSDLRYWQSKAAKTYGVRSIPFTVLLDKNGNIIATKLRGAALEQKLAEIFGE